MTKIVITFMCLLVSAGLWAQTKEVTGRVTDSKSKKGLSGITVRPLSGKGGTSTDGNGNFSLKVPNDATQLTISSQNYTTQVVEIGNGTLSVSLELNDKLSDVVVTGYKQVNKRGLTGSASTVAIDDIRTQPIASFDQLLQGQAPGLSAKSNSGQPGAAAQVIIRGRGSISGSVNPLYILDGIEITPQDFATLNQGDFESVTVLKDAVTAGIYGSRGANGVIVITSRKGKSGATKFNYDFQVGKSRFPSNKLELMNTQEKLAYEKVNGNPNGWSAAEFDSLGKINTNWEDVFFREALTQSHQLSASGGSEFTKFYTSIGFMDQQGIVQATGLKRYTFRLNLETGNNNFKTGINSSVGYSEFNNTSENNQGIGSPLNALRWTLPYFTAKKPDGSYVKDPTPSGQPNALQELLENRRSAPQVKVIGSVFAEYKLPFLTGLSIKTLFGADYTNNKTDFFSSPNTNAGTGSTIPGSKGSLFLGSSNTIRLTNTNSISYKKTISNVHDFNIFLAQESVVRKTTSFSFTGYGFTEPFFTNASGVTNGSSTFLPFVTGNGTDRRLVSYFAEGGYSFKNKIFANANIRKDVSSAFAASKKSALLGGIGAAWVLTEENFMKNAKFINYLKIKANYGTTGNQEFQDDFPSISKITKNSYAASNSYAITTLGNPLLTWETRTVKGLGIDFAVWNNRIKGGIEYYNSTTNGLYNFKQIPLTSGYSSILFNEGKLNNSGIEVSLTSNIIESKNFVWALSGNFTYNRNKLLSLPDGQTEVLAGTTVRAVGFPLNTFKLNRYLGVDPATGFSIYGDLNGKPVSSYEAANSVNLGTSDAPYFGGITNTLSYKGLSLGVFWTYAWGNEIYNNDRSNVENPAYIASSISRDLLREWRNPGDITDIPKVSDPYESSTTRYLENGSFWRLRNIDLGYNLPAKLLGKAKLGNVRVFLQGQNLITITKFRGFDPEITNPVLGGAQYPALRTVTAGLNIGF